MNDGSERPAHFRLLFVCTGNICRSPMAERLALAGLTSRLGRHATSFSVISAGTRARDGAPMEPAAAQLLHDYGADPAGFRARALSASLVTDASLILGAAREHRGAAVTLLPSAATRTFTLREFVRLASVIDTAALPVGLADRPVAAVTAVAGKRGYAPANKPADDDIPDPYGGSLAEFRTAAEYIAVTVNTVLDVLTGRG